MTRKESFKLFCRKVIYSIVNSTLSFIPKKKGLVLFTSWLGQKYLDNPKYVYEYFLEHSNYIAFWMTKDRNIYELLKNQGKPVEFFNTFRGIWLQIRAEAVFSTIQFADFNTWLLSRCLYVDLNHGHPIKDPGDEGKKGTYSYENYKFIASKIPFYSIVAGSKTKAEYNVVPIPPEHIFISDFARNDALFDKKLKQGQNTIVDEFKKGRKAIVYMPTQRSRGQVAMNLTDILPLSAIQKYCEINNSVFIVKKHFYHRNESENLSQYLNILDVTQVEDIDPQILLCQADMLITDYSACYIDYMLLKRPIVFFQYDLQQFTSTERSLYYNFKNLDIAPVIYEKEELVGCIEHLFKDGDRWLDKRMKFAKENYFDNINHKAGRKKVKDIFDHLYSQYLGDE